MPLKLLKDLVLDRKNGTIIADMKNITNSKIKAAEALYYKNLIESAEGPKKMWRSLNSVLGEKKTGSSVFQLQDGKRLLSEPKVVALI